MTEIHAKAVNGVKKPQNGVHTNGKMTYAEKHKIADHFIGGNKLDNAPESKVKDFVAQHDGHTVITNVSFFSPLELQDSRLRTLGEKTLG